MKHKILIAADKHTSTELLLTKVQTLLNETHLKYISVFLLDKLIQPKAVVTARGRADEEVLERIEFEMQFEREATSRWMNFQSLKSFEDLDELVSYSTVCDLLLLEHVDVFERFGTKNIQTLIDRVHCPVVILPNQLEHDSIVIVNDSSLDIVNLTKSFLNLFNPELRKLPLSVFVDSPETESHILNERAFVDYLKLYFKNIGTQLMDCDAASCIQEFIHKEGVKPILLMNSRSMKMFNESKFFKSGPIENVIAFVIKGEDK